MMNVREKIIVLIKTGRSSHILVLIILFHFINNLIWLFLDNTYLLDESSDHFLFSFKIFNILRHGDFPWLSQMIDDSGFFRWHAVFIQYFTAPLYFIFGMSQDIGAIINGMVSLSVLILSIFGIGRIIFDEKTGLLAAFIVSMCPLIFNHSRIYMLDLPLTAMVALSILLLLKSEGFSRKRYAVFFALAAGVGLLTKFNFALFMIGPIGYVFYETLKEKRLSDVVWRNVGWVVFLTGLISFSFYRLKSWEVIQRIYSCSWLYSVRYYPDDGFWNLLGRSLVMGKDFLSWFIQDCVNSSVTFLFLPAFIIGCFSRTRYTTLLFSWLGIPVFVLAFLFHNPNYSRYLMPVLPVIALLSGAGIMAVRNERIRRMAVVVLVGFGLVQFFAISYKTDFLPERVDLRLPVKPWSSVPIPLFNRKISANYRNKGGFSFPVKMNWRSKEIVSVILKDRAPLAGSAKIFFSGDRLEFYEPIFYEIIKKDLPLIPSRVSLAEDDFYLKKAQHVRLKIKDADYLILSNDLPQRCISSVVVQRVNEVAKIVQGEMNSLELLDKFAYPDGAVLTVYKRKKK